MKKIITIVLVLGVLSVLAFLMINKEKNINLVTIDINPSVGFEINDDMEVENVLTFNEDAMILLSESDLEGKHVDEAIKEVVSLSVDMGYLDQFSEENVVSISTFDDNELDEHVTKVVEEELDKKYTAAIIIREEEREYLKDQAEEYDITFGKMLLVDKAVRVTEEPRETFVDMSIKDIMNEIHEGSKKIAKTTEERYEKTKETIKEKAKEIREENNERIRQIEKSIVKRYEQVRDEEKEDLIKEEMKREYEDLKRRTENLKENIDSGIGRDIIEKFREKVYFNR